jgi:hypothetical protein
VHAIFFFAFQYFAHAKVDTSTLSTTEVTNKAGLDLNLTLIITAAITTAVTAVIKPIIIVVPSCPL